MNHPLKIAAVFALAMGAGACTIKDTPAPPLSGPSEMALSLALTANPDVLSLDGASQSQVTVVARDTNGQPKSGVLLRAEIVVNGVATDYGALSARTRTTGSGGSATFTYTAPAMVGNDASTVQLSITPEGPGFEDASTHLRRVVTIRLVVPGTIGEAPTAAFSNTPESPAAFTQVKFDASASNAGLGALITSYAWDFGDGTSGTGVTATHQYDVPGTYAAKLTVTNSSGLTGSVVKQITVGAGAAPVADFIFSPQNPSIGATIFFNGTPSQPGVGHQIVRYQWNFGDGTTRTGSTTSKAYSAAGIFNVVLTVTDEAGQTDQSIKSVTVGASPATASFNFSPTNPTAGTMVVFNASGSRGEGGNAILAYAWNFGCVAGTNCDTATGTGVSPNNRFTVAGTYQVTLTITDSGGKTATSTLSVTVS